MVMGIFNQLNYEEYISHSVRYLKGLSTVLFFIGHFKSVKTCVLSVQHYSGNRYSLGERRWCSTRERIFITEQLLRTGSTSLLLFRKSDKTCLTTWLTSTSRHNLFEMPNKC